MYLYNLSLHSERHPYTLPAPMPVYPNSHPLIVYLPYSCYPKTKHSKKSHIKFYKLKVQEAPP